MMGWVAGSSTGFSGWNDGHTAFPLFQSREKREGGFKWLLDAGQMFCLTEGKAKGCLLLVRHFYSIVLDGVL